MYCYSVPSKFIHIYFLLKRKGLNGVKKKKEEESLYYVQEDNKWVFSLCEAEKRSSSSRMPPTQQGILSDKCKTEDH